MRRSGTSQARGMWGKMLGDMELEGCKESVVPETKTMDQGDDSELRDAESAKRY